MAVRKKMVESVSNPRAASALDRQIGQRIRSRRLELGMAQEKLAALIGVTFQQVQKYEKGVNRVSASTLTRIADALAAQFSSLMPDTSKGVQSNLLDDPMVTDLAVVFLQLSPKGRRLLLATAKTFLNDETLRAAKG